MANEATVYLDDILESIALIEQYLAGQPFVSFEKDFKLQDSVMRRLEIIGEAVKNLNADFKNQHSSVPWRQIAGMRDILIHEYGSVLLERVWQTAKEDLPTLKQQIKLIRGGYLTLG